MSFLFEKAHQRKVIMAINILVAMYFITILTVKKGYSTIPMVLGGVGIIYLLYRTFIVKAKWHINREDRLFIGVFLFYVIAHIVLVIIHQDSFREIDAHSKLLLIIAVLAMISRYPINHHTLINAIPIGAAVSGLAAIYQKFYLNLYPIFPDMMSIQAGNIAVTLGNLSFIIVLYKFIKKEYNTASLYSIFTLLGILASFLSGARGGWVSLPIIFILGFIFFYRFLNKKIIALVSLCFISSSVYVATQPQFGLIHRYEAAKMDILLYINHGEKFTSIGGRFDLWENAFLGIQQKPLLGWGNKGYKQLKQSQVEQGTMAPSTLPYNDAHNQYIDEQVKWGILGLAGLLALFILPLYLFAKHLRSMDVEMRFISILGVVHILSTMIFCLTQSFLAHNSGLIFYAFTLVILYGLLKQKRNDVYG